MPDMSDDTDLGTDPGLDLAGRRRRQPLVTREKVVAVAYELLVSSGPAGLSMRKLATALHVSLPTVYTAIRSREFLVQLLQNRMFEEIAGRLAAADAATPDGDRLRLMTDAFLDWAQEHRELADFLLSEKFSVEVGERLTKPDRDSGEGVAYLVGLCRELVSNGALPAVDPMLGVAFAFAQIRAMLSLMRESALSPVPESTWRAVTVGTLVAGLHGLAGLPVPA